MSARADRIASVVFLLVVAPLGAAVLVSALLLFGVPNSVVFAPGFAVLSLLSRFGVRAPNAIGVLVTVAVAWTMIVAGGALLSRARGRGRR